MSDVFRLDKKKQSQLDLGGVLRSAHDDPSQSLRIINGVTEVPSSYSRVNLTYNGSDSVTRAIFYEGTQAQETEVIFNADVAGSLNNTYFYLNSENNESKYHVWYNVSGGGTDPAPVGSIGVEIPIETNDTAEMIALSTEVVLKHVCEFYLCRLGTKLIITNSRKGAADASVDVNTGFSLTTIETGTERLLKSIDVPYDGKTKYLYNTQDKRFEVFEVATGGPSTAVDVDADTGDNIAISRHENPRNIVQSSIKTAIQLDTSAYTNIFTYTATEELRVRVIKIKADTFGIFKLIVDGEIRDYKRISNFNRNCVFEFIEDESFPNATDLEIEFVPERIKLTSYDFFMRIEAYVD